MRWGAVRPVGEPLAPMRRDIGPEDVLPAGFQGIFVQSGTAALALALLTVKARAPASRRRVILPAYGCPDLVAATVYAGLEPYLVDTAQDSPFYDQEALAREIDDQVLVVVCVHFLGFRENVAEVTVIAERAGAEVVEDSAQAIPSRDGAGLADLVVMSFGRGKPAGALGGGALVFRDERVKQVSERLFSKSRPRFRLPVHLRRNLYNLALSRAVYGPLSRMKLFGIGETVYTPLEEIALLDRSNLSAALTQLAVAQLGLSANAKGAERFMAALSNVSGISLPGWVEQGIGCGVVTRLPIVAATRDIRDRIYLGLLGLGLGASIMYGTSLPYLHGMPALAGLNHQNAKYFSDHVVTLPAHSGVTSIEIDLILAKINAVVATVGGER